MNSTSSPVNVATLSGMLDTNVPITELLLPDGSSVQIQTALLFCKQQSQEFRGDSTVRKDTARVIPLLEEQLEIGRQVVETGKVRLKGETEYSEQLNEPLVARRFDVERIVLNQPIDVVPTVRQEGETTIYPVVEEQLVLTRQLILTEEVRVTRRDTETFDTRTVTLRREHLIVEREEIAG